LKCIAQLGRIFLLLQEVRPSRRFLRTGGGPPGVLLCKSFFLNIFLESLFWNFNNFFSDPHIKFIEVFFKIFFYKVYFGTSTTFFSDPHKKFMGMSYP